MENFEVSTTERCEFVNITDEVARAVSALGIKDAILDAVAAHTMGVAQSDDITLVVIRRQG